METGNGAASGEDDDDLPSLMSGDDDDMTGSDGSVVHHSDERSEQSEDDANSSDKAESDGSPPALVEESDDELPALVVDCGADEDDHPPPLVQPPSDDDARVRVNKNSDDENPPELMSTENSSEEGDGDDESDDSGEETSESSGYDSDEHDDSDGDEGPGSAREKADANDNWPHLKRGFLNMNLDKGKKAAGQAGSSATNGKSEKGKATPAGSRPAPKNVHLTGHPGLSHADQPKPSESFEEWEARRNRLQGEGRLSNAERARVDAVRKQEEKARREELRRRKREAEKKREVEVALKLAENKRMEEMERITREKAAQEELLNAEIGTCRSLDTTKCPNLNALIVDSQRHIEVACSDSCLVKCHYPVCWKVMESRRKQDVADWKLQLKATCITPDCPGEIVRAVVKEKGTVEYALVKEEEKKRKDHEDVGSSRKPLRKREKLRTKSGSAGPEAAAIAETLGEEADEHQTRRRHRGPLRGQWVKEVNTAVPTDAPGAQQPPAVPGPTTSEKAVPGTIPVAAGHAERDDKAAKALRGVRPAGIPKPTGMADLGGTGNSQQQAASSSSGLPENGNKPVQQVQQTANMEEAELVIYKKDEDDDILIVGGKTKGKKGKAGKEKKKKVGLHEFNFQPILDTQLESYEDRLERMLSGDFDERPPIDLLNARPPPPPPPSRPRPAVTAASEFPPLYIERARGATGAAPIQWKEPVAADPMESYFTDSVSTHMLVGNVDINLEDSDMKAIFQEFNPIEMLRFYPQELAVLSFNSVRDTTAAVALCNHKCISGTIITCCYLAKVPPWDLYSENEQPPHPPESPPATAPNLQPRSLFNPPRPPSSHPSTAQAPPAAARAQQQPTIAPPKHTEGLPSLAATGGGGGGGSCRDALLDAKSRSLSPEKSEVSSGGGSKRESRLKADVEPFVPSSRGVGVTGSPGSAAALPVRETVPAAVVASTPPAAAPELSPALTPPQQLPPPVSEVSSEALDGPPPLAACRYEFGNVIACNNLTLSMYKQLQRFSLPSSALHRAPLIRPNNSALFMLNVESFELYGAYTSNCSGFNPDWIGAPLDAGASPVRESIGFEPIEEFEIPLLREDYEGIFPGGWFQDGWMDWSPELPLCLSDLQVEMLLEALESINTPPDIHGPPPGIHPPPTTATQPILQPVNPPTLPPAPPPPSLPHTQTLPETQANSLFNPPSLTSKLIPETTRDQPSRPATPVDPPQTSTHASVQLTVDSRPSTPASTVPVTAQTAQVPARSPSPNPLTSSPAPSTQTPPLTEARQSLQLAAPSVKSTGSVAETISALLDPLTLATSHAPAAPSHAPAAASHAPVAASHVAPQIPPSLSSRLDTKPTPRQDTPPIRSQSPLPGPAVGAPAPPPTNPIAPPVTLPCTIRPRTASPQADPISVQPRVNTPPLSIAQFSDVPTATVQPQPQIPALASQGNRSLPSSPMRNPPGYPPSPGRGPGGAPVTQAPAPALLNVGGARLPSFTPRPPSVNDQPAAAVNSPVQRAPKPVSPPPVTDHKELFPFLFPKVQPQASGGTQTADRGKPEISNQQPHPPTSNVPAHTSYAPYQPPTPYTPFQPVRQRPPPYNPPAARPRQPYNPMAAVTFSSAMPPPAQPATSASPLNLFQSVLPSASQVGSATGVASRPAGAAPLPALGAALSHPSDYHGQRPRSPAPQPPNPANNRTQATSRVDQQAASTASYFMCRYCNARRSDFLFLSCRHFGPCLSCSETKEISSCLQCGSRGAKETWQRVFL